MSLAAPDVSLLAVTASALLAASLSGIRFLRVAQREHYVPMSTSRFALRWWGSSPVNRALLLLMAAATVAAALRGLSLVAIVACGVVAAGPLGLSLRGRTSKLRWTRRLGFVAVTWLVLELVIIGLITLAASTAGLASGAVAHAALASAGSGGNFPSAALMAASVIAVPLLIDGALWITSPVERRLALGFVRTAQSKLRQVSPTVVAITGSYGKTSTKGYIAHLLGSTHSVLASPASFNNRAGLARAVNENLAPGTDVFVAEMGTFGPGEIAELCSWIKPDIAVITAIGPVHLERFGSEDRIAQAKAEITTRAATVVLNIDDERLAGIADALAPTGKTILRVSGGARVLSHSGSHSGSGSAQTSPAASSEWRATTTSTDTDTASPDVEVFETSDGNLTVLSVTADGIEIARIDRDLGPPGNIACAVAVAHILGVPHQEIARLLPTLPVAPHRLGALRGSHGALVLDDTYNSNPAGARRALDVLRHAAARDTSLRDQDTGVRAAPHRIVMVTPGMVELGNRQHAENVTLARNACSFVTDFIIVGRTNRRSLLEGARLARVAADGDERAAQHERGIGGRQNTDHGPDGRELGNGGHDERQGATRNAACQQGNCTVRPMANRDAASTWCREHLRDGDVVLFENDLPDHYP